VRNKWIDLCCWYFNETVVYICKLCSLSLFLFVVYKEMVWRTFKKILLIRAIFNIKIIYKNCLPTFLSILIESNLSPSHNVYARTYHSRNYWIVSLLQFIINTCNIEIVDNNVYISSCTIIVIIYQKILTSILDDSLEGIEWILNICIKIFQIRCLIWLYF